MNTQADHILWWSIDSDRLRFVPQNLAVGGSGYTVDNPQQEPGSTFVTRAAEVKPNSSVVVFFGGVNDRVATPTAVHSAALQAFRAALKVAPHAKLLVIGPPWPGPVAPPDMLLMRDAVRSAAKAAGAAFADPIAGKWLVNRALIGSDGVHPTDAGHKHLAAVIDPLLAKALLEHAAA